MTKKKKQNTSIFQQRLFSSQNIWTFCKVRLFGFLHILYTWNVQSGVLKEHSVLSKTDDCGNILLHCLLYISRQFRNKIKDECSIAFENNIPPTKTKAIINLKQT